MSKKIWDVTAPRDNWERHFAWMAYQMLGMQTFFVKKIKVKNG